MRNRLVPVLIALIAALTIATVASAQAGPSKEVMAIAKEHCGQPGQPGTQYQVLCSETKSSAPAPKHDISGSWSGPIGAMRGDPIPPLTDIGKKMASVNHGNGAVNVADSNDPLNHCDPLGFPRNAIFELRGLAIGAMSNRVLILSQYERIWREVWTDGRANPKNAGGDDPKVYAKPFLLGTTIYKWIPDQQFEEQLCIPSEAQAYADNIAGPAGAKK